MKKIIFLCLALLGAAFSFTAYSQCTPPPPTGSGGWNPKWQCFDCIERNTPFAGVLGIEIPASFGNPPTVVTLDSIILDRIENVPTGITYTITPGKKITGGSTACLDITGTTSDTAGTYKAAIYVKLYTSLLDITTPTELGALLQQLAPFLPPNFDRTSFDYYLRVIEPGATCDTSACDSISTGINPLHQSISELSVLPNPFAAQAEITWHSNTSGKYTAHAFDLTGKEVMNKELNVARGQNSFTFAKEDLPNGVYFFVISDGKNNISAKLTIRD